MHRCWICTTAHCGPWWPVFSTAISRSHDELNLPTIPVLVQWHCSWGRPFPSHYVLCTNKQCLVTILWSCSTNKVCLFPCHDIESIIILFLGSSCACAADTLACLRSIDANTLGTVNADIGIKGFSGTFLFVPVVDGSFIRQRPTEALKQGKVNGVSQHNLFCHASILTTANM
jgi:hypothetical protein